MSPVPVCRYERQRGASSHWAVLRALGHADFPAAPSSVACARAWTRALLAGAIAPCLLDDALLLLSEVVTNAVVHSDSGRIPGGSVTVCLGVVDDALHVEVIDDGSADSVPFVRAADSDSDGGRGLLLVELLAAEWGVRDGRDGTAVWFRLPG
ncbi:ATP-binding protein [Streptosporangium sp. NPDC048047]|uniref:ATP-binding protein n=1 Tax=Streptosporangium sp. NPDC048047 TaxID=3155748 RepID=UPI00341D39F6